MLSNENIAKALGLLVEEYRQIDPSLLKFDLNPWSKVVVSADRLYCHGALDCIDFSIPRWQEKIRDRVRALWCGKKADSVYQSIRVDLGPEYTDLLLLRWKDTKEDVINSWSRKPEAPAWLAALNFLSKEDK